jgi:SAM-dependent methyltransferase
MEKWSRFYSAAAESSPPPWCSGKPSTHLARYLRRGSVRAAGGGGDADAHADATAPPRWSPSPPFRGDVLDLGCGSNGTNVALLASHGYRAAGVDLVPEAVARARRGADAWRRDSEGPPLPPPSTTSIAFAAADVMAEEGPNHFSSWEDVRRMELEQFGGEGGGRGRGPVATGAQQRSFSLLFDCQTFHVLRTVVDERLVVARYRSLLAPGGALVLLCGRPLGGDEGDERQSAARSQRSDGPNEVSLNELRAAFCPATGWREREIVATRFDSTTAYDSMADGPPSAWAAVFCREAE